MVTNEYDFWLFDLDGTVVDVEPAYPRRVLADVGDRLGVGFTDREVEILWYGVGGSRDQFLAERGVDSGAFWEAFHEVEDPLDRARSTFLYDDAAAFLAAVDRPVGLVTHCQASLTDEVLDHLDIRDWFDAVVCCTDETGWKPDPTPVELAMRDIGLVGDGHGALAGDDPDDVGAAWNAGLDAVHVERHDPVRRGQCVLGDRRVGSFADLVEADDRPAGGD